MLNKKSEYVNISIDVAILNEIKQKQDHKTSDINGFAHANK